MGFPAYLKSKCSRRTKSATPKRRQLKRRAFGAANNFFMFELLEARYLLSANQFTSYQYYQWDNEVMGRLVGTDVDQRAFGDTNSTLRSSSTALTATERLVNGGFETGDGNPGGDFVVHFTADVVTVAYPEPLDPKAPLGSLIYDPSVSGTIEPSGDTDSYTINVDDGQTITVVVDVANAGLQPSIDLSDAGGSIGSATAAAAGEGAVLQTVPTTRPGIYTVTIGGAAGSTGDYSAQVVLNSAVEDEEHGGSANGVPGSAQDIEPSFITLGSPRGAVLGTVDGVPGSSFGPDAFGYEAISVPFTFEDISATGSPVLTSVDDSTFQLTTSDLAGFEFNLYGTTYAADIFISSNGLITFGTGNTDFFNDDMTLSPSQAAIAPLWDDLVTSDPADAVFWELRGTGTDQRLIIQWNDLNYIDSPDTDLITFQAVLFEDSGDIQFNYLDLVGSDVFRDEGASATVGIKDVGTQGVNRLVPSFNAGPNAFVGSGQSTLIGLGPGATPDYYSFSLDDGQSATLALTGQSAGDLKVDLFDTDGATLLAMGMSAANLSQVINNFVDQTSDALPDTFFARVTGDPGVDYSLVVTKDGDFDTEANNDFDPAQDISGIDAALGHVPAADEDWYQFGVNTGDILTVETFTPADGPFEFNNLLDPQIELFTPTG